MSTVHHRDPVADARALRKENKRLRREMAIMKKSLQWYAQESRYKVSAFESMYADDIDQTTDAELDAGKLARAALLKCEDKVARGNYHPVINDKRDRGR